MKISSRLLLPALLLGAPLALGAEGANAPQAAASAPAERTIDVSFRGSLRDALKTIADKGGLNLVVTGDLDTPAEVHLRGVTATQALRTVSRAYSLRLDQDGSIFTLRPMTAKEKEAAASGEATEAAPTASASAKAEATPKAEAMPSMPSMPPMPAMPPMPPMPPMPGEAEAEDAEEEVRLHAEEMQEQMREQMQQTREHLKRNRRGGRDVVARGQSLEVKEGQDVDSAVVYGGNLVVKGHVEDDAVAFGGNLEIHGHVEGDAHAFGGNVILGPDARVEGDVSSFGGTVERADGAQVDGSVEAFGGAGIGRMVAGELKRGMHESRNEGRDTHDDGDDGDRDDGGGLAGFILTFAVLFGLGFLGQMFFPARMKQLGDEIRHRPVQTGLTGFLGLLAMVPLTVVLCVTIIGIPAALVLWMAAPLAAALGYAAVASEVGMHLPLLRGRKTQAVVLALGLLVLMVIGAIPVLGVLVSLAIVLMALGAVIRTRFGNRTRGMPEPVIHSTEQPV